MTVSSLKTYALQTLGAQMGVQQGDAVWRALASREGLRPMTDEERRYQTDEAYFLRNWSLIQLKKGRIPRDPRVIYGIQLRILSLMKAAIGGGHPLASAALGVAANKVIINSCPEAIEVVVVSAITGSRDDVVERMFPPYNRDTTFWLSMDRPLLRAVSKGTITALRTVISAETRHNPLKERTLSEALYVAAACGYREKLACLIESFKDRLLPAHFTGAYWWAVSTGHLDTAQVLQPFVAPNIVRELKPGTFRIDFSDGLSSLIRNNEIEWVDLYLEQKECMEELFYSGGFDVILDEIPELNQISTPMLELLLSHERLRREIVLKRPIQLLDLFVPNMYSLSIETMTRVIRKVCQSFRPIPRQKMLLARELHGTPIIREDLTDFYQAYGRLLTSAVDRGNVELLTVMLSIDFPHIPPALNHVFIAICHAKSRSTDRDLTPLRLACLQNRNEMAWLLDNVAF